jgi:autophagy-related protein 5
MGDTETDRLVWNGRIPVAFALDPSERGPGAQPSDAQLCYVCRAASRSYHTQMLVPRCSYLTLCTEKIRKHYQLPAAQSKDDEVWFEYKGQPLKWYAWFVSEH